MAGSLVQSATALTPYVEALREKYDAGVARTVFRNTWFDPANGVYDLFPYNNDRYLRAKVQVSGIANAAVISAESDSRPAPDVNTYNNFEVEPVFVWNTISRGRKAKLDLQDGWFDAQADQIQYALLDLKDLLTRTMLTDSAVGLTAAIDDDNSYGGIARGSATYFESAVIGSIGTLNPKDFRDLCELMENATHDSKCDLFVVPQNQYWNYMDNLDFTDATKTVQRSPVGLDGVDLAGGESMVRAHGAPLVQVRDLTNTVILGLNLDYKPMLQVKQPVEVREVSTSDFTDQWEFSYALGQIVKNPIKHGKLEGITA